MATEAELARRWQTQVQQIRQRSADTVASIWDDLGSWNRPDIERFFDLTDELFVAIKDVAAASTDAFLSTLTSSSTVGLTGADVPAVPPSPEAPFLAMWKQLSDGVEWSEALAGGRAAAENLTATFVTRTASAAGDAWFNRSGVQNHGWRRQLSGVSCEWCALVATQVYRSAESATFGHKTCDCVAVPILDTSNVSRGVIDDDLYRNVRAQGVSDRVSFSRRGQQLAQSADTATRRMTATLAELRTEQDPARRMRLQERARSWERRANHARAQAAEHAARDRPTRPEGSTGYVDTDGRPAPRP